MRSILPLPIWSDFKALAFLISSVVTPKLAAIPLRVSPSLTTYLFFMYTSVEAVCSGAWAETASATVTAGSATTTTSFFTGPGTFSTWPILMLLLLRPFACLSSLCDTPCLIASLPSVSPFETL